MLQRVKRAALLGLACGLAGVLASLLPGVLSLEESVGLGWLFALRGPLVPPAEVAVVSIDAASAEALGLPPKTDRWPRTLHADLVDRLAAVGATVVAFDIMFDTPRAPDEDARFAAALARAGNVVLLDRLRSETVPLGASDRAAARELVVESRVPPVPPLKTSALASAPFPLPVVPVTVSQFWTFGRSAADTPTLPSVVLQAYLLPRYGQLVSLLHSVRPGLRERLPATAAELARRGELERGVSALRTEFERDPRLVGDMRAGLAADASIAPAERAELEALLGLYGGSDSRYLNYYGPQRSIATVPYHRVLADPAFADAHLRGKAVFVGFSETRQPEQLDFFYSVVSQESGLNLAGVEIAATAFANLLDQRSVATLGRPLTWLLVLLWGVLVAAAVALPPAFWGMGGALLAAAGYLALAATQFVARDLWLPVVVPLLFQAPLALFAALAWSYGRARRQAARIQHALGYYLPPRLVEQLARETVDLRGGAQLLHGTCLVTDAAQYTALSEGMHPAELRVLLNDYYHVLVGQVQRHHGFVSDIVGDSMVAVWASAEARAVLRADALAASRAMLTDIDAFNETRGHRGLPTRIGLHYGDVLLGNVGAESHFEYRAIGDIVNTASRIQGLNKLLGTRLLVSQPVLEGLAEPNTRELGAFRLAGKSTPVVVHELIEGDVESAGVAWLRGGFAAALAVFRTGRWEAAAMAFAALLERCPGDGPSRFYAALAQRHAREGRGAEEAAVVTLLEK